MQSGSKYFTEHNFSTIYQQKRSSQTYRNELRAVFLLQRQNPHNQGIIHLLHFQFMWLEFGISWMLLLQNEATLLYEFVLPLTQTASASCPSLLFQERSMKGTGIRRRWSKRQMARYIFPGEGKWAPVPGVIASPFPEGTVRATQARLVESWSVTREPELLQIPPQIPLLLHLERLRGW